MRGSTKEIKVVIIVSKSRSQSSAQSFFGLLELETPIDEVMEVTLMDELQLS